MECGPEGRLGNSLDRKELVRQRTVLRVVLTGGHCKARGEVRSLTYLELEADAVCFGNVEKLDELASDAVDPLDVVF